MTCAFILVADIRTGSGYQLVWISVLWSLATILLVIGWRSRWVKPRPLLRYVLLSVYCHVLLAVYASTILWLPSPLNYPPKRLRLELFDLAQAEDTGEETPPTVATEVDARTGATVQQEAIPAPEEHQLAAATPQPSDLHGESLTAPSGEIVPSAAEITGAGSQPPPAEIQVSDETEFPRIAETQPENNPPPLDQPAASSPESLDSALPSDEELPHENNRTNDNPKADVVLPEMVFDSATDGKLAQAPNVSGKAAVEDSDKNNDQPAGVRGGLAPTSQATVHSAQQTTSLPASDASVNQAVEGRRRLDGQPVPMVYRNRFRPDRIRLVEQLGGSEQTEQAVARALHWLAANQAADGRWPARLHGAGQERRVLGQDRGGAGGDADTGVTGLALLAFLGAGHTHIEGQYSQNVHRAASFLIEQQAGDGNLSGGTGTYAAMYCHAISFLALAELHAVTGDAQLRPIIERAYHYTLSAQSPYDGGWRYRPRDPQGDTSQFGWQLLALKSAELSGWTIPQANRSAMEYFLTTVSSGRHGGLASYRAGMAPTAAMTAEAMVCRHLLELAHPQEQQDEAAGLLLRHLPHHRPANLYYWYYASLALFLTHHRLWPAWNQQVTAELLHLQVADGPNAGSWNTDTVWGGYGGRVYTTSMAALCLEIYYRFDRQASGNRAERVREAELSRGILPR